MFFEVNSIVIKIRKMFAWQKSIDKKCRVCFYQEQKKSELIKHVERKDPFNKLYIFRMYIVFLQSFYIAPQNT